MDFTQRTKEMKHVKQQLLLITILGMGVIALQAQNNSLKGQISEYLEKMEGAGFSGSVLVAHKGEVLLSSGYGYSDRAEQLENTAQTVFDIGSITKQFTAAAILKLEMMGKLMVTDKMSKYIDGVPADKEAITLHHLLTHSAGFPGAIGHDYVSIETTEFIREALAKPLLFEPGSQYEYSNVGYSLLGIIVEKISGQSYETFLREHLWLPAGMKQTGYQKASFGDIAVGYKGKERWGKPTEKEWANDGPYWHLRANGGVLSTVEDMYRWHQALLDDKILNTKAKAKYYQPHIEEGEGAGSYYAYGWAIFPTPRNTELIAHNGGNGIFFADMWRYLEEDITVIFMTNEAKRKFEDIVPKIVKTILTAG